MEKVIYQQSADLIPEWQKISRSDLCNLYLENKDTELGDSYLSAIILKYWNTIGKNFYKQGYMIASEEDCYDWMITAILETLNQHIWTVSGSNLYGDPNGPEKAINMRLKCEKINFYVACTRQKRSLNYNKLSLDKLREDYSDDYFLPVYDQIDVISDKIYDLIVYYFNRKEYIKSFSLDAILNYNCFDDVDGVVSFNIKKLKHHLKYLDSQFVKSFSDMYNTDFETVLKAVEYVSKLTYSDMDSMVSNILQSLKHDKVISQQLGD